MMRHKPTNSLCMGSYLLLDREVAPDFSSLKSFMSCYKYFFGNAVSKFTYVSPSSNMFQDLNIKENILLLLESESLTLTKSDQLEEFLNQDSNQYLKKLFSYMHESEHFEDQKLIALCIVSLIKSDHAIFIDQIEKQLSWNIIDCYLEAIKIKNSQAPQLVIIRSHFGQKWRPYCQSEITKLPDYHFCVTDISKSDEINHNNPQHISESDGHLEFILPDHLKTKKIA